MLLPFSFNGGTQFLCPRSNSSHMSPPIPQWFQQLACERPCLLDGGDDIHRSATLTHQHDATTSRPHPGDVDA
ncbi:hypothetical protein BJF90_45465 [Pseudonocardia sp. CNS-004]|nr:hypothetical protein BJF90_45465 [Pseudonocardia sp. CNS-004]